MQTTPKRWTTVAAITLAAALVPATLSAPAMAEPLAAETMLAERTNPAMHLVVVKSSATASMKTTTWTADGRRLIKAGISLWAEGRLGSADDVLRAAFTVAADDPERYFKGAGKVITKTYTADGSGSGFVVNGDGYLVTARHVVTDDETTRQNFVRRSAADFATDETKAWKKFYDDSDPSESTVDAIKKAMAAYTAEKVKIKMKAPAVSVVLGVASADGSRTGKVQPAEVVYRSSPELKADIALLRIRGTSGMPTVSLADKSLPQGAQVYINCFPALPDTSEAAVLTPTMTAGRITSVKLNEGGIEQMQTDAQASPGCSGGAALNTDGNVVGVLVSGAVDSKGGSLGQFYLMPIDVVQEALRIRNIGVSVSLATQVYDQALADYSRDHYTAALAKFREVESLYAAHPYVDRYISQCQAAISEGKDKTPPPVVEQAVPVGALIGGGAGAVALLVVGTVTFLLIRRRQPGPGMTPPPALPGGWGLPAAGTPGGGPNGGTQPSGEQGWPPFQGWAPGDGRVAETTPADADGSAGGMATAGLSPTDEADLAGEGVETDADGGADDGADEFPADDWVPIGYVPAVPADDSTRTG